jgi:sugar diacid utilization regulator
LHAAEDAQSRELSRTIRAFTDCNFNVKRTAHILGVHTNTIYFRLNRTKKLSGLDPRTYAGASTILAALRLLEVHGDANTS